MKTQEKFSEIANLYLHKKFSLKYSINLTTNVNQCLWSSHQRNKVHEGSYAWLKDIQSCFSNTKEILIQVMLKGFNTQCSKKFNTWKILITEKSFLVFKNLYSGVSGHTQIYDRNIAI